MPPFKINPHKKKKTKKEKTRTNMDYSEAALASALKDIREGRGIREACRFHGIPRTTVQDRLSGRTQEKPRKVGPDPILGFDGEEKLVDWIVQSAKCGIPIKKEDLLDTVAAIAKDLNKDKFFAGGRPGQKWYQGFLKRHPDISVREPEGINKAREAVKEVNIRKWFSDLEQFLQERGLSDVMNHPERILNADETGVSLCPKTGKVLAPKGFKNVYTVKKGNEKENLTVLLVITASGQICPPLVVYPYIRPPKAVVNGTPSDWVIGKSETGWMRSDVFYEYIANDFNNWLSEKNITKPVILFVDGHKSHMSLPLSSFCEENGIILYALLPNTTHILQPADVSVFRPLKQNWRKTVKNWQNRPENIDKAITKTNFCAVFKETLDVDMTETIKNGFRKCGLFPFNVEEVDFTKCVRDMQIQTIAQQRDSGIHFTERHFQIAKDIFSLISGKLAKRGIDTKVIECELEKARTTYKRQSKSTTPRSTPRNSSSKTPRISSSKTPRNSSSKTPRNSSSKTPRNSSSKTPRNSLNKSKSPIIEIIDLSAPNVGSVISLDGVSIIPFDDTCPDVNLSIFSQDMTELENNFVTVAEEPGPSTKGTTSNISSEEIIQGTSADNRSRDLSSPINLQNMPLFEDLELPSDQAPISIDIASVAPLASDIHDDSAIEKAISIHDKITSTPLPSDDKENTQTNTDPFAKHLKYPLSVPETKKKSSAGYVPSAISSKTWREYHNRKDQEKQDKEENIKKRKLEREAKKNEKLNVKKRKVEEKKKKTVTKARMTINCYACQEELISDTEDDAEKNIGCDDCVRWYHLKCTKLNDMPYSAAAESEYTCYFCESAKQDSKTILREANK